MFIGRERERKALQELYHKEGFCMSVIYGRKRVGKSTLIAEFTKDKKTIFYTATKVGRERNMELFSNQVLAILAPAIGDAKFSSVEVVFDFISRKMLEYKFIIVIDELPYWTEKDEALLSVLQKYIDTQWKERNLMLILCGAALPNIYL